MGKTSTLKIRNHRRTIKEASPSCELGNKPEHFICKNPEPLPKCAITNIGNKKWATNAAFESKPTQTKLLSWQPKSSTFFLNLKWKLSDCLMWIQSEQLCNEKKLNGIGATGRMEDFSGGNQIDSHKMTNWQDTKGRWVTVNLKLLVFCPAVFKYSLPESHDTFHKSGLSLSRSVWSDTLFCGERDGYHPVSLDYKSLYSLPPSKEVVLHVTGRRAGMPFAWSLTASLNQLCPLFFPAH